MNVAMLNRPSINQADLKRRAQEAQEHFRSGEHPWVLTASEDWFGFNSESILASIGLVHKLELLGMLAERLSPPTRRLPEVQLRWISDEETPFALADLNADVYERPQGVGEASAGLRCALARTAIRTNRLRRRRARLGRVYPANR